MLRLTLPLLSGLKLPLLLWSAWSIPLKHSNRGINLANFLFLDLLHLFLPQNCFVSWLLWPHKSCLSSPIVGPSVSKLAASQSDDPPVADLKVAPPSPPRLYVCPGPISLPPLAVATSPMSLVVSVSSEKLAPKPLKCPAGWQTILFFAFLAIFF